MQKISDFLIAKRVEYSLTQDELALKTGLSVRSIQNYEAGERPGAKAMYDLAGILDFDPIQFGFKRPKNYSPRLSPKDAPSTGNEKAHLYETNGLLAKVITLQDRLIVKQDEILDVPRVLLDIEIRNQAILQVIARHLYFEVPENKKRPREKVLDDIEADVNTVEENLRTEMAGTGKRFS